MRSGGHMGDKKSHISRRELLTGAAATAAYFSLNQANAQSTLNPDCKVGFELKTYTVQGQPIYGISNPGPFAAFSNQYVMTINHFKTSSYVVGASGIEQRNLLCVDTQSSNRAISDIYVFDQADNSLLFWRKVGSADPTSSAMFVVPPALQSAKVTIVLRSQAHGYWGTDFDLSVTPVDYATAVNALDTTKICGGVPIARPYTAPAATGGQGNLGILHRPNIIPLSDGAVKVFLGGALDGSGRHPRFASNHYIMGGILLDQNSNLLSAPGSVIYASAANQEITFTGFSLSALNVKTLRAVMFDSLQGRLMGFLDI
jgi:hypothetical protein